MNPPDDRVVISPDYEAPVIKPATALRSGTFLHVDEQLQTAAAEAATEVKKEEDAEAIELRKIAALADHPGWQVVRKVFEERIAEYRSGRILAEALADPKLGNAEIGSMTRVMNLVAGELTTLINKVELAALENARQREETRNATIRERMVARTQGGA